jgi:hypothetical protein
LVICWADRVKVCKVKTKNTQSVQQQIASTSTFLSMASSAASQGAGIAAALVGNEKKDQSTFVEIGISVNVIFN